MEEMRQRALRSDMDDFITKPIEIRQLLAAVERSLDDRPVVLVADDCVQDRQRMLRYLRSLDRVGALSATTGAEAVATCEGQRVTFALISVGLPDMGGIEAVRKIRSSKYGADIGIVAVGEKADAEARQKSLEAGCSGFLERPFGQAELVGILQPMIGQA
jgi:CheY-like chemotaxis protein